MNSLITMVVRRCFYEARRTLSGRDTTNMNENPLSQTQNWIIWGTGELCDRFWNEFTDKARVSMFVDSNRTGKKKGLPVIKAKELNNKAIEKLFICSSWFEEIAIDCKELGILKETIFVVMPRSLEVVPLTDFESFSDGKLYYLPWKSQIKDINLSLSSDIVHPDVYKDITKSVSYCFISSVDGDFAEFGTCTGYTASLIAYAINFYSQRLQKHEQAHNILKRELCLFDSFEGFPEATLPEDMNSPHVASGMWGAGTAKGLDARQLENLVQGYLPSEQINIYEGWYKDTLSTIGKDKRFAFVHMDCDLYESTIDVLRYLFSNEHVSQGAMLLFDNWYCNKASADFAERRAWLTLNDEFEINFSELGMYACVGHRLIIHSYFKKS